MARFTVTRPCGLDEVDATVRDIVRANARDSVAADNEGQTVLIDVKITALPQPSIAALLLTCILGNIRHDL